VLNFYFCATFPESNTKHNARLWISASTESFFARVFLFYILLVYFWPYFWHSLLQIKEKTESVVEILVRIRALCLALYPTSCGTFRG
jgi:hypothetical protein